jgi:hypothetical protein
MLSRQEKLLSFSLAFLNYISDYKNSIDFTLATLRLVFKSLFILDKMIIYN